MASIGKLALVALFGSIFTELSLATFQDLQPIRGNQAQESSSQASNLLSSLFGGQQSNGNQLLTAANLLSSLSGNGDQSSTNSSPQSFLQSGTSALNNLSMLQSLMGGSQPAQVSQVKQGQDSGVLEQLMTAIQRSQPQQQQANQLQSLLQQQNPNANTSNQVGNGILAKLGGVAQGFKQISENGSNLMSELKNLFSQNSAVDGKSAGSPSPQTGPQSQTGTQQIQTGSQQLQTGGQQLQPSLYPQLPPISPNQASFSVN